MLLEFKVSNYRSIGEEQTISLIPASKLKEQEDLISQGNILQSGKHRALNVIALYGPNGGGKSNILKAMNLLDRLIHISAKANSQTPLPYDPFLLRDGWESKPTMFEISFIVEENRYRYGIEYKKGAIEKEWLFRKVMGREVVLFEREGEIIDVSSGYNGVKKIIDIAVEATRDNALFLSTCDLLNVEEAKTIMKWFANFRMVEGVDTDREEFQTIGLWETDELRKLLKTYLTSIELGILDIEAATKDFDIEDLPQGMPESIRSKLEITLKGSKKTDFLAKHITYNSTGKATKQTKSWKWEDRESSGSNKMLHLSGPLIWTLNMGGVLIIDEIEAKLHPVLTQNIINLFFNKKWNKASGQLIFATHDTNLLTYSKLGRDQICFAEKNNWESTEVFALSEFVYMDAKNGTFKKGIERPDLDKEKRYFEGRYGAIPVIENLELLR